MNGILNSFDLHKIIYVGDCSGTGWSGSAVNKAHFISSSRPPADNLKVRLLNNSTNKREEKKYNDSSGSNKFSLDDLGNGAGSHSVEYKIFDKKTDQILEEGSFTYTVQYSEEVRQRSGQWRQEVFCANNETVPYDQCTTKYGEKTLIKERERLYCGGSRKNIFRNLRTIKVGY